MFKNSVSLFFIFFMTCVSSSALRAANITDVKDPQGVISQLTSLYNDNSSLCRELGTNEVRGLYYCSGIIVRGVQNGNYLPWTFGPNSHHTGGVSFSWLRHDVPFNSLLYPAGLIVENPGVVPGERISELDSGFRCVFPIDASTGGITNKNGCGLYKPQPETHPQPASSNRNNELAWGQCEALGINTVDDALYFHMNYPIPNWPIESSFCSWNIESPAGWLAAISLFNITKQHGNVYDWNELILHVPDKEFNVKTEVIAFFYTEDESGNSAGLDDAKVFQRKLYENGKWVPVIKLSAYKNNPVISYSSDDQHISHPD